MAYVSQQQQIPDEEKNKFANSNQTTPQPIPQQTGGSAGVQATGGRGAAPGVGTPTQFGSSAARLSDYLKANQSQVGQFGQKVGQSLTDTYNQTVGNVTKGFGDFTNQVNQGYKPPTADQLNQATTNPNEFVKNPENVSSFKDWWSGSYKGPQNVESQDFYSGVNNDVQKALEQSNVIGSGTMGGLSTYLRNYMGSKTSAPGTQMLDAALLQRSPEARNTIQAAAAPYKGLNDFLASNVASGNEAVKSTKEAAKAGGEDLKNKFIGPNGAVTSFQQGLDKRVSDTQAKKAADIQLQKDLLQNGKWNALVNGAGVPDTDPGTFYIPKTGAPAQYLTDEQLNPALSDLGISRAQLGNLLNERSAVGQGFGSSVPGVNYDLSQFFSSLPQDSIGIQNVATPDDYAMSQAYAQLANDPTLALYGSPNPGGQDLSSFNYQGAIDTMAPTLAAIQAAQAAQGTAPKIAAPPTSGPSTPIFGQPANGPVSPTSGITDGVVSSQPIGAPVPGESENPTAITEPTIQEEKKIQQLPDSLQGGWWRGF